MKLTYWDQNKIADISQTTFSNIFSWMKIVVFWLNFNLCLWGSNNRQKHIISSATALSKANHDLISYKHWANMITLVCLYHLLCSLINATRQMPRYFARFHRRSWVWCMIGKDPLKMFNHIGKFENFIFYFVVCTVPADGLALLSARTSAGTLLTKFRSRIYTASAIEELVNRARIICSRPFSFRSHWVQITAHFEITHRF